MTLVNSGLRRANCSEYFPIFISLLWVAGIFFHQGTAAACGLLYLYTRFQYFQGYTAAAQGRSVPAWGSPDQPGALGVGCSFPWVRLQAHVHHLPLLPPHAHGHATSSLAVSKAVEGHQAPPACFVPRVSWRCLVSVFSPRRLGPLYTSARVLWLLLGLAVAGLLAHFLLPHSSAWMAALAQPLQLLGAW
ncbi:leukotriene C4 synthase isoform X2 [Athene cunicularia]|uniref:leukotriene C4 synthase isoform X2 n=1 Tax=Athene cunicularia TaxID=194338 RepID=UPI000EF725A6|nr:leukotriene C4 synthase isoform X2 [Athene cunicularia]